MKTVARLLNASPRVFGVKGISMLLFFILNTVDLIYLFVGRLPHSVLDGLYAISTQRV